VRPDTVPVPERNSLFSRYWQSAWEFWRGSLGIWALAAMLVLIVVLGLLVQYRLNIWNRDFFDALERKDGPEIWQQALVFLPLALSSIMLACSGVWGRMTAQRRWREWLSRHLITEWLANGRYRQLHRVPGDHENPEYRIAEDARVATDAPVDFAVGLLTAVLTAITFIDVLWGVGGDLVVDAFGRSLVFPGYLVIAAVVYASVTTGGMLLIGRRLVVVVESKNVAEAELRHAATRMRENVLRGELQETGSLAAALWTAMGQVITGWRYLCTQLMRTTVISQGNSLLTPFVGLVLCAPKYLADLMTLGQVTQAAAAFVTVQAAFSWLVDNYPRLADWRSSVHRVASLLVSLDTLDGLERSARSGQVSRTEAEEPEFGVRDGG
jgi:vitamin B12/bleomycin/antimicrobial peptide transport system ATP-binding/permease protein